VLLANSCPEVLSRLRVIKGKSQTDITDGSFDLDTTSAECQL